MIKSFLKFIITSYAYLISPWLGNRCRFHPSCSLYAKQALDQHGILKGGGMAIRRLLRCGPWSQGGYDPVLGDKKSNRHQ